MPSTMEQKAINELVNKLIAESFGKRAKGTCSVLSAADGLEAGDCPLTQADSPNDIVKEPWWSNIFFGRVTYIGHFTQSDGSALEVRKEYTEQANEYAKAYQEHTGKSVTVTIKK